MNGPHDYQDLPPYVDVVAAAKAYRKLNAYYRTQSRPPERLFKALDKANRTMAAIEEQP